MWVVQREEGQHTSGARKGRDCISKLIREVSVPVTLKQLPKSISFTPTPPLSATTAGTTRLADAKGREHAGAASRVPGQLLYRFQTCNGTWFGAGNMQHLRYLGRCC